MMPLRYHPVSSAKTFSALTTVHFIYAFKDGECDCFFILFGFVFYVEFCIACLMYLVLAD